MSRSLHLAVAVHYSTYSAVMCYDVTVPTPCCGSALLYIQCCEAGEAICLSTTGLCGGWWGTLPSVWLIPRERIDLLFPSPSHVSMGTRTVPYSSSDILFRITLYVTLLQHNISVSTVYIDLDLSGPADRQSRLHQSADRQFRLLSPPIDNSACISQLMRMAVRRQLGNMCQAGVCGKPALSPFLPNTEINTTVLWPISVEESR
ncbi:hypothetical protein J6590_077806 [Homalodisca vitripennis]|nr:hypothetical protein J6590_077806 [Homalodisca vitripennis]